MTMREIGSGIEPQYTSGGGCPELAGLSDIIAMCE
jgi:hypothetical protein